MDLKDAFQASAESRGKHRRSPIIERSDMPRAKRIVVKVGSSSLTSIENSLDELAIATISDVLAKKKKEHPSIELVFVSSGAIAAGLAPLGLSRRPKDLATQQAAASVGQSLLMSRYTDIFTRYGVTVSQVLLTAEDLMARDRYQNAHRQLERLLDLGVMPIINENDAVATREIRFGDNDRIAALVAHTVKADALLLLSDVDALYTRHPDQGGERVSSVRNEADLAGLSIGSVGSAGVGSGGMVTKVKAAQVAAASGIPALVTSAAPAPPLPVRTLAPGSTPPASAARCRPSGWSTWPILRAQLPWMRALLQPCAAVVLCWQPVCWGFRAPLRAVAPWRLLMRAVRCWLMP